MVLHDYLAHWILTQLSLGNFDQTPKSILQFNVLSQGTWNAWILKVKLYFLGQASKLGSRIGISQQTILILGKEKMSTMLIVLII